MFRKSLTCILILLLLAPVVRGEQHEPIRVACLFRTESLYWENVKRGVDEESAAQSSLPFYLFISGAKNVMNPASAVKTAVLSGCDAILTAYADDEDFAKALADARQEGVCVVFLDNDGPEELRDLFVGVNYLEAGHDMGQEMIRNIPEGSRALLCVHRMFIDYPNQALLAQGVQEAFADSGRTVEFFYDTMNTDYQRQDDLDRLLRENEDIRGLFSFSQLQTRGYASLLSGAEWKDRVYIVGLDYQEQNLPYIRSGCMSLLEKNSFQLGRMALKATCDAVRGAHAKESVSIDYRILNAENIEAFLEEEENR